MNDGGWREFNKHVRVLRVEDSHGIVAVRGDRFVGGAVYDNCYKNSTQAHICILEPLIIRSGFLELVYRLGFGPDREYAYGQVLSDNEKAIKLNKHMGFTEKCRFEDAYAPGIDVIFMEMKRENCRYL